MPIANLDLPAARSTAGKRRPLPGEEPRGVAPRTRELPHGTISGEEGASSSAAVRSESEASEASDAEGGDEAGGSVTEPPAARSSGDRGRAQSAASVARTRRDEIGDCSREVVPAGSPPYASVSAAAEWMGAVQQ